MMEETMPVETAVLVLADGSRMELGGEDAWPQTITVDGADIFSAGSSIEYHIAKSDADSVADYTTQLNTLMIPAGMQYDITLQDGPRVWLGAGSQLKFPSAFTGTERRVYLRGEGYFEAAHDPSHPFRVETETQVLTVLGTRFNISAYPDENIITTLVEGRVSLLSDVGMVELKPGEQAELDMRSGAYSVREVDAAESTLWKEGLFVVDNNTLEQVMAKLARWYGVEIVFNSNDTRNIIYRGTIPRYGSISDVLERIEEISPVRFEYDNKTVKVM
jgi:ferric-dicitrate binding protein FerR (iron transport regulator)